MNKTKAIVKTSIKTATLDEAIDKRIKLYNQLGLLSNVTDDYIHVAITRARETE